MKWLRTLIVFDKGDIIKDPDWEIFHKSYREAIENMVHPAGSNKMIVRRIYRDEKGKYKRNGVGYLRESFLSLMSDAGWVSESSVGLNNAALEANLLTYPDCEPYIEEITSKFGEFDFVTHSDDRKVAVEWETGNISSSHRSLNKLCIALKSGTIDIGVLIVPSRGLYNHLTERIGNIGELSPYLSMWKVWGNHVVEKGLLAVTVVEHDELTDDENIPLLRVGGDGNHILGQNSVTIKK